MSPAAKCRASEVFSVALLCLNFGLFLVNPLFGASRHPTDAGWGQPTSEQDGQLTEESLKAALQNLRLGGNKIQEQGSTDFHLIRDVKPAQVLGVETAANQSGARVFK